MTELYKLWSAIQAVTGDEGSAMEMGPEMFALMEHLEEGLNSILQVQQRLPPSPTPSPPTPLLAGPVGGALGPFSATSDEDLQVIVSAANAKAKAKKPRPHYNHHYWPSPIPQVLAREMFGRHLIYEDALKYLAMRTGNTVEDFLMLTKRDYLEKFGHLINIHGAAKRCGRRWAYTVW
jgi:hypothetical protein